MAGMRRLGSIALLIAALGLAACGDDGDDATTVTSPGVSETTAAETETTAAAGPSGTLTAGGVGDVSVGASAGEVRELFGDPASEERVPGCELAGPQAPKVTVWRYELPGGELLVEFDEAGEAFTFYRSSSPELATERGDRVGASFASVRENWPELEPVPLGEPTPKLGFWWVREGEGASLLFDVRGGRVAEIQGGDIQFCE